MDKIIWQSKLTAEMVKEMSLTLAEQGDLINELDKAVQALIEEYQWFK